MNAATTNSAPTPEATPALDDPRPAFRAATAWVVELLDGVSDDQLDSPTPCDEFDVRTLSAHLVAVAERAAALAEGVDIRTMASIAEQFDARTYAAFIDQALDSWSDDAKLSAMVQVPWGEVPGAGALWGYVSETLVHGWDLAVATGRPPEADAELAETTLGVARQFIPAAIRTDPGVPFGPVVEPRPEAGPTERLANWTGRQSVGWVA
ncbi:MULTISPECIES: TIGR03086 family metal-binding protein [Gordonia]|uniref:TIGR03086 family protein n=2 Tax=Gordonia terrae TaxID=2055 RepID=A0AAD0KDH3_9ACTN|nr:MULTISPECIES: TIGR03086 family metal-binding protein [Gordonia]VTR12425.1 Mycothiol maleylpyruvate isomerase N-terminal domain [Clostridioides difficile]ANY24861.1 TIGR03086 family protein [Gordonia terrae]AWO85609.1 TIGR03086 family protein [Gordonia terrae]MCG7634787.1 TIGR03086 family metal-binding protein [Gordonia sp. McavH-238-E]VTS60595.1 Mycothiol maleylpyruvate isomerase N-terminal domain [Gordonia terrae]